MRIIPACELSEPILLSNITLLRVVYQTTMRIIQEVRIGEGQIIRAILYLSHGPVPNTSKCWSTTRI